jgi:anti-sigma B factor antagonist
VAATEDRTWRGSGGDLEIRCRTEEGRHLIELQGELDLAAAGELRGEFERAGLDGSETVVDLRRLEFIDSTGLSVLFDAFEKAEAGGRRVVFTRSTPTVERTLRLTGLDRVLPML